MAQQGLSGDDLKPAFLLLSGCEMDLAKRAKLSQASAAEEHYKTAETWLQKVYGVPTPPVTFECDITFQLTFPRLQFGEDN